MKILGDDDMGKGGIDVLNTETGESTTVRERETDGPFTIDDYNKVMQGANETQQVKRADMINAQNEVSEKQQIDTGEELPKNPGGIQIAMRPKVAVNIMRCQFPAEVTTEINSHIDDVIIPNNVDHSKGLVGQIRQNERSAQLTFPHEGDEVGEMFSGVLQRLAKNLLIGQLESNVRPLWNPCGQFIVIMVITIQFMTMALEHQWVYL